MNTQKNHLIWGILGAMTLSFPVAGQTQTEAAEICPACKTTAVLTFQSALAGARSEYYRLAANASTLKNPERREEAMADAGEQYIEEYTLAREQHEVRLELCGMLKECQYDPVIKPEDFLTPGQIAANPNPYWPMIPGTTFRYQGKTEDGVEVNEVRITKDTREIMGVICIVVRDIVWLDGDLREDTLDWYAQDKAGNVWYFGELTVEYEEGELTGIEGSWEAGVEGGKPGIIMKAKPQVGDAYRQEYSPGVVEDAGTVLAMAESITVPFGTFKNCLKTGEFTPMEPETWEAFEHKFYAPGVGMILEAKTDSDERHELIAIEKP